MPRLSWSQLGCVDYGAARRLQERLAAERARGAVGDLLLLLEHPPVVTVGRNAPDPVAGGAESAGLPPRLRVDRGGAATYHGPGQLVVYPVVALRSGGRGVRNFVDGLEDALCDVARGFGIPAVRRQGLPGAWVEADPPRKLGSVGIAVRRGISLHGASLNVTRSSARGFAGFDPCGLPGVVATSLEDESPLRVPPVERVGQAFVDAWATVAGYDEVLHLDREALRAAAGAGPPVREPGDEVSTWT